MRWLGTAGRIEQYSCTTWSSMRWKLQGTFNQNKYTIPPATAPWKCWDIPYRSNAHGLQIETYVCNETPNQQWLMR